MFSAMVQVSRVRILFRPSGYIKRLSLNAYLVQADFGFVANSTLNHRLDTRGDSADTGSLRSKDGQLHNVSLGRHNTLATPFN